MSRDSIEAINFRFGLVVIDMQNGFVSKGGSYDHLGMNIQDYQKVIPKVKELIQFCRTKNIPIFYTEAVREATGIDLLTRFHRLLPLAREERLKVPITVRGTWDAQTIDEIKPTENDHIVIKRRDGAFQDTELRVWLQSEGINTLVFCGIDTSICVETSLREAFNIGYDVILVSDSTASGNKRHYETTLERVRDYYGLVLDTARFYKLINSLEDLESGKMDYNKLGEKYEKFLSEFSLIDVRKK
ncbi:cysteine hydrolase family protein [Candidatus Nitrosocosmicus agrestis]|jgi:ureidoacrylate peracid hydrolase|uniref:cysteine hydrolase family protein n=1 Tax=Candidatus Nitrosocosmicus agrestis TaxID=2563600 RepID=UPI00122E8CFF|nr:isochorismatase family cysteine hydrolase [Candidatus Nitrosocosmicus sp. SS]KAA2281382.1 cysteine hydrolase [Candidatus Nitrosocosmicus sp. SS]KAF0867608.1 cysteine hydrolase [Candidatus Nitrosocosmicus sp. SS]MDR4492440.1 cysteine hydrolase [Candidatus Nitrosocosmicus sp.]